MIVKNQKRNGRMARILAERDGVVLYHAIDTVNKVPAIPGFEKGSFYPNMVRPSDAFWQEYSA